MDLILYTSPGCVRCKLVKQMLDKHNVSYIEISDKQVAIDKGLEQAPALEVDGKLIDQYNLVLDWLREHNYYSL